MLLHINIMKLSKNIWNKENLYVNIIYNNIIQNTSTKMNTFFPIWNEHFLFKYDKNVKVSETEIYACINCIKSMHAKERVNIIIIPFFLYFQILEIVRAKPRKTPLQIKNNLKQTFT